MFSEYGVPKFTKRRREPLLQSGNLIANWFVEGEVAFLREDGSDRDHLHSTGRRLDPCAA